MSKTIKLIDLFNIIAKGEEIPVSIKYKDEIYICRENNGNIIYQLKKYNAVLTLQCFEDLNNIVEIIEEQQDIDIQAIEEFIIPRIARSEEEDMWNNRIKINELIKAVKQLDRREER